MWIWEQEDWPVFRWDESRLAGVLVEVDGLRQTLRQRCLFHGEEVARVRSLEALVDNITASYAIEGEAVDSEQLRSSLGRRLEVHVEDAVYVEPASEALAKLVHEVTGGTAAEGEVTLDTLQAWHRLLFPEGISGSFEGVGEFRSPGEPMFVFGPSRAGRRPVVHFEAPPGDKVPEEVSQLVDWLRDTRDFPDLPGPVRAGIAHLWLVTIHPWDDGNGRMSRAVGDRVLADWDAALARLFPLSVSLLRERRAYYHHLETTQRGGLDVTEWLLFFLEQLGATMERTVQDLDRAVLRQRFWTLHADKDLRPGQRKLLGRMLSDGDDNFSQGVAARHYAGLAHVAKATATRHLTELRDMGVLVTVQGTRGTGTRYVLAPLDALGAAGG